MTRPRHRGARDPRCRHLPRDWAQRKSHRSSCFSPRSARPLTLVLKTANLQGTCNGASRDRTGDLLLAKQIGLSAPVPACPEKSWKCAFFAGHLRTREDGGSQPDAPLVHPRRPSLRAAGGGELRTGSGVASAGGGGAVVWDRPRLGDRRVRGELRHVLELVDHVAVGAECESRVVAELAGDVDH
jgi:hypothetical protein